MLYNQFDMAAAANPQGRSVLLVDDSKLFHRMLRRLVEGEGGRVVGMAESGVIGAEMANSLKPELIIMDHNMPDMDGVACLRAIRQAQLSSKVIVCSGELTMDTSQEYARLGVSAIFVKPLPLPAFTAALRACLN